jgi:hypothetical protein
MNYTLTSLHTSLLVDYREETYQSFFSISQVVREYKSTRQKKNDIL